MSMVSPIKRAALPEGLRHFSGELTDIDSHEMMPAQVWVRECGPIAEKLAQEWMNNGTDVSTNINHPNVPGYETDDAPIDPDTIWSQKGSPAPGTVDVARRDEVMDVMGIKSQLMFPTGVGMYGTILAGALEYDYGYAPSIKKGRREYGLALIKAYNQWGMRVAGVSNRVRPVLPLMADTVPELLATAREFINNGIRAIWLPSGQPPGGKSPAHEDLEPFWQLMEDNKVAVCLHGSVETVYRSDEWRKASVFEGFRVFEELRADPWSIAQHHILAQNFLCTTVLGGVFDRHPDLRFGAIELTGAWLGPLCDVLDMWYDSDVFNMKLGTPDCYRLPQRPSFYIKRNVRLSCFDFEPIDKYVTQYDLGDVICFASDYPHIEGGRDPIGGWYKRLAPLGQDVVEKFFVTNGKWLLPD